MIADLLAVAGIVRVLPKRVAAHPTPYPTVRVGSIARVCAQGLEFVLRVQGARFVHPDAEMDGSP